ncbi:hypothetical protein EAV90_25880 [Bradyrhizobium vignae]|nr:hypothetical protein EAV90_25880 [Bradyrhizobium vignae]
MSRLNHCCLGVLDRPVKPGDGSERVAADMHMHPRGSSRPSFALMPSAIGRPQGWRWRAPACGG